FALPSPPPRHVRPATQGPGGRGRRPWTDARLPPARGSAGRGPGRGGSGPGRVSARVPLLPGEHVAPRRGRERDGVRAGDPSPVPGPRAARPGPLLARARPASPRGVRQAFAPQGVSEPAAAGDRGPAEAGVYPAHLPLDDRVPAAAVR